MEEMLILLFLVSHDFIDFIPKIAYNKIYSNNMSIVIGMNKFINMLEDL